MAKKKDEITIRSSAAEYLTYVASVGDQQDSIETVSYTHLDVYKRQILNAANQVIANNTERKAKTLWTENEEGSKVHFRQLLNAYEEAEYVVKVK